ncbi:hypothetical protein [Paenibacillus arenilitoris]|uniref:Uncharacterized protein n=1 Tax=Paenibacillus arenilitoris TaxID=2772299 RepID=A0A927CTY9_9BACL|nr:hypothetical protein [Paenibacillus arenilitoris]MBD2872888.1 hypothetical protein [Paenibacillus arenilitoris]
MQIEASKPWNWLLFPFSSIKAGADGLYAASVGHGVYHIDAEGNWDKLHAGLPEWTHVNRLQLQHDLLHACTDSGLYEWNGDGWKNDGLNAPCYQFRKIGGTCYAATDCGLWTKAGSRWEKAACEGKRVFDFLNLPQYLIVAHEGGISLYDRFMDDWAHFDLQTSVTSLVTFKGHLIGSSDTGELIIGDKKGRFDRVRFGRPFLFSVLSKGRDVYACTDRGLFQLAMIREQVTLLPVKLGCPVTDVDMQGDSMYMATLFQGIQSISM